MSQHTPGPWRVEYEIDGPKTFTRIKAGKAVATTAPQCGRPHHRDEMVANAHLIAAAPDLLAAVKILVRCGQKQGWTDSYATEMKLATEAIAKAEGRSTE